MSLSAASLELGAELRPDTTVLSDLAAAGALSLCRDVPLAERVRRSIAAASSRFTRPCAPWLTARVGVDLTWPVLTVTLRCAGAEFVEYFDVSGLLGVGQGAPVAMCEVIS